MRYAQIDSNGICFAESFLSGEVNAEDMILLSDGEPSPLGKKICQWYVGRSGNRRNTTTTI